jgi:MSHA pilin protein MshA
MQVVINVLRAAWATSQRTPSLMRLNFLSTKILFIDALENRPFFIPVPSPLSTTKCQLPTVKMDSRAKRIQAGFSLIELIAVVVILGVLAAIALPRFVNLRADANEATIRAMGGALLSSANLVYAKSAILGVQGQALTNIDINGDGVNDVEIEYGYPSANRSNGISKVMDGDFARGWTWSANAANTIFWLTTATLGKRSGLYVNNTAVQASNCYLLYYRATSASPPTIQYVTTGC